MSKNFVIMKKKAIFAVFLISAVTFIGCTLTGFALKCAHGKGCEIKIDSVQINKCDTCSQSYVKN